MLTRLHPLYVGGRFIDPGPPPLAPELYNPGTGPYVEDWEVVKVAYPHLLGDLTIAQMSDAGTENLLHDLGLASAFEQRYTKQGREPDGKYAHRAA